MKKILLPMSLLVSLYAVESSDDFDDMFGDTTPPILKEVNQTKNYSVSYNGFVKVRGYGFIKKEHYENYNNDRGYLDSIAELSGKIKKDKLVGSATVFGMMGSDHDTYDYSRVLEEFRDTNKEVPIGGIKELYGLYSSDNYDLLFGKKVFKVGISTLYSPSDVYNTNISPDPLDPYTIGTWIGKASYYHNNSEFSFALFPFISTSKTFSSRSRWAAGNGDNSTKNQNGFIIPSDANIIKDRENRVRALFRMKSNAVLFKRGIDYMFDFGYGPSLYTILEKTAKKNTYLETRPEAWYVSSGFSTTYKKLEVHGEVYYQNPIASRDDSFISAVGGATYNLDKWVDKIGFNEVKMILEYVREIVTDKADSDTTFRTSEKERAPKNDILIKLDGKINDKFSLTYFGNFRLELNQQKDSGRYQQVMLKYKINDALDSDFFVETFNGEENSYYGKWKDNDRIGTDFKYSF